jgi:uncharacterized Zn finger protein (UPF0148 family)
MDKYAVVIDEEQTKIASKAGRPCPQCGSQKVNYKGVTPHCPNCGVEPWEKHAEGKRDFRR